MNKPNIAGKTPAIIDLEKDKTYAWCSCGKSEDGTWCNGSHKETTFTPKIFKAEEDKKSAICACKHTSNPPYCDGSHNKL